MKTQTKDLSISWQACLMVMLAAIVITMPELAFAGNDTPMGKVLCTVVGWFIGNTGKGLATIAITVIGVGVAIVFGAAGIVDAMNAGAGTGCATT